ncbi:MAG: YiiX/YebB-like N1pC/P60 family cysteine hydrolase [Gemmatimonadales bacterium]|nr:YiiX/YebB-like N1pC/P60 family cysteine hydrolase [Gemmatimonadales bacterium]MDZ4390831.1 YiiX/YebB-like N1pC/P60 family cysteine hydrolase [Gemmatimonadales bacterium]
MILDRCGRSLARFLSAPRPHCVQANTSDPAMLAKVLRPGDILLVEGSSRISTAIKYLTQSSWSHAAFCIAPPQPHGDKATAPAVLLEADVNAGVRIVPLESYAELHTRICRPIGLTSDELAEVIAFTMKRLGHRYDMKNIFDLARYFLPIPPVPSRYRRRLLHMGSGDPTRAICSSLIAEAFQSVGYPVLPNRLLLPPDSPEAIEGHREALEIRHHSLFTPRDFDVSPYFRIVKPTLELGFDPHNLLIAPREFVPVQDPTATAA